MLLGRSRATRRHGRSVELLQLQERARGQRGHLGRAGANGSHECSLRPSGNFVNATRIPKLSLLSAAPRKSTVRLKAPQPCGQALTRSSPRYRNAGRVGACMIAIINIEHTQLCILLQSVFDSLRAKLVDLTFPNRGFTFTGSNPSDGYSRPCASACNVEVSSTTR